MKELDLINNEGPNLKIKRFASNQFKIVDEWGIVLKITDQYKIFDWIDGREKLVDSKEREWVWSEQSIGSKTPLVEIIKFIFN
jgi:hypothetical protein